jgi:hypothetical protein
MLKILTDLTDQFSIGIVFGKQLFFDAKISYTVFRYFSLAVKMFERFLFRSISVMILLKGEAIFITVTSKVLLDPFT